MENVQVCEREKEMESVWVCGCERAMESECVRELVRREKAFLLRFFVG